MEDGLRLLMQKDVNISKVLILVFVEDGLRHMREEIERYFDCLNPCFCGRWSATLKFLEYFLPSQLVLILVFVEDGLRLNKAVFNYIQFNES